MYRMGRPGMRYYHLNIAYEGTRYHGWQYQEGAVATVAGVLEKTFRDTFHVPMSLVGASRTDAGVHAYDQVARCRTLLAMPPDRLQEVWNRIVPPDILIRKVAIAQPGFHPQHNVATKIYWYHLFVERPLPFLARYGWYVGPHCDVQKLAACLEIVQGTHDFRSFCTGPDIPDTVRTINRVSIVPLKKYGAYRVALEGPSFLYKMIRRIVGSAVYVAGRQDLEVELFREVFADRTPLHTLPTAPAQGLLLRKIMYDTTKDLRF